MNPLTRATARLPEGVRAFGRRHGDLVVAVGLAALLLSELAAWNGPGTDKPVTGAAGAASALALALRRRTPLASFLVFLALSGVAQASSPAFFHEAFAVLAMTLFALYSLGAHARGTEAWLGVGGLLLTIALIARSDGDFTAGGIAFYCALCGLPWGTGLTIRLRSERVAELEAHNTRLREEAAQAVADERARIARELHDVVSHAIAITVLQARGGRRMVGRDEDAVRRALGAIEQTNTAALADMRRLLALLRSSEDDGASGRDDPAPSLRDLDRLLDHVRSSGVPVELVVTGEALPLPPGLDLSAYRIVQEALTNVLKHAGPDARARVEVEYAADDLGLAVVDAGLVPPADGTGHGLVGIHERVSVAGGSVQAGPEPGGYAVRARLPYLTELVATPTAQV